MTSKKGVRSAPRREADEYWLVLADFRKVDDVLVGIDEIDGRLCLAVSSQGRLRQSDFNAPWSKAQRGRVAAKLRWAARALESSHRIERVEL